MKSPSDSDKDKDRAVAQTVNAALDQSVDSLSLKVQGDIARATTRALTGLQQKPARPATALLGQWLSQPLVQMAIPGAAAVLLVVAIGQNSPKAVPELPLAMVTSGIPTEALTLLEDLEFVTWLAENEADALL